MHIGNKGQKTTGSLCMAAECDRMEPADSEQDEEDVYEVERIIDMRVEEVGKLARPTWPLWSLPPPCTPPPPSAYCTF